MIDYSFKLNLLVGLILILIPMESVIGQQSSMISTERALAPIGDGILNGLEPPPANVLPATILANFIHAENKVREALTQHTFKRDVLLQTIGPNGEVTGQYIRNSEFIFDDHGNRIERVIYRPPSTIREMRITKEDIQDLAGSQLLGLDVNETNKYHLEFAGKEFVGEREAYIIQVSPKQKPNPHQMKNRFFIGRIWVDVKNFQVVKVRGVTEPQGKQRFPVFETVRKQITNSFSFPSHTEADQVLHFTGRSVHYRIKVRYYDYRRFTSTVSITEVDGPN